MFRDHVGLTRAFTRFCCCFSSDLGAEARTCDARPAGQPNILIILTIKEMSSRDI